VVPSPRGGALHEAPVFVGERDREPVELELAGVLDGLGTQSLTTTAVETRDVFLVEGIGKREHRDAVNDFGEALARRRPDTLRGRIGRYQLGVRGFEGDELMEELVVLGVGDFRRGLVVVEPVVALDLAPQQLRASAGRSHQENRRRASAPPAGMPCPSMSSQTFSTVR
jgi:hypothetical protein